LKKSKCLIAISICILLVSVSCSTNFSISPPYISLEKDGFIIHIAGTYHFTSEKNYEEILSTENPIVPLIESSDLFFSEYGPVVLTEDENTYIQSIILPRDDDKNTVQELIDNWDVERRDRFLSDLETFPMLNQQGRRQFLLDSAPFFAHTFLENDILVVVSGISTDFSIDSYYRDIAERNGIPHYGLQSFTQSIEINNAMNQSEIMEAIEYLINLQPTPEAIRATYQNQIEEQDTSYRTGMLNWDDKRAYIDLGANPEEIDGVPIYGEIMSDAIFRQRELIWVNTIEDVLIEKDAPIIMFAAVGYAHLGHPDSVFIDRLLDNGWTVMEKHFESEQ
jgi:hypothetical protein